MSSDPIQFVNQFSGMLVCLNEPAQIFTMVCQKLGQHLQLERCFMGEREQGVEAVRVHPDYHAGLPSIEGLHNLDTFPPVFSINLIQNRPLVVRDVHLDPATAAYRGLFDALAVRALVVVPYIRQCGWSASLIAARSAPYAWPADEISLLQAVSDLAWLSAENTRLSREIKQTGERLRLVAVNSALSLYSNDLDLRYTWVNATPTSGPVTDILGKQDSNIYPPQDAAFLMDVKRRVLETGIGAHLEFETHFPVGGRLYDMSVEPMLSPEGEICGLTVIAFDITESRQMEEEARRESDHLKTSRLILQDCETERMHIAQKLHDGPLQTVMGLSLELNEAIYIEDKAERVERLKDIRARMQTLTNDLRNTCARLRPPTLAPFGLEQAIRSHLEAYQDEHPELQVHLDLMPDGQNLNENVRQVMFRIYQELLDNVAQHACASQVAVHLTLDEAQAELEIQDNGQGFELPSGWLDLARHGHFGLAGICERAEALNGRVFIRSTRDKGTLVRVIIPRTELQPRAIPQTS